MLSNVIILQITYYHLFMLSYKISACLLCSQYTEPGRQSELDYPFRSSGISLLVWSVDIVFQSIFNGHMRELSTLLAGIWYKGHGLDMSIRNVGCMFSHIFKLKLFSKIFNTRALLWEVVCEWMCTYLTSWILHFVVWHFHQNHRIWKTAFYL